MPIDKKRFKQVKQAASHRVEALPEITDDMTVEEVAAIYRRMCQQRGGKTGPDEAFTGTPEEATAAYRALLAEVYGTNSTTGREAPHE
ncbi:hypothetical protein [Aeromonas bestiarum]|uniref:hypothetical protein n=1 Tax=Aeromonas bestiarum TaxID=105751 RepID=UPI0004FF9AB4|nr:hypothetical protein [Aeromonas bestiarum]KFN18461.1 hypothetical protein JM66_15200 [Aeromonas bestiarum]